jgi:hypothetical protein
VETAGTILGEGDLSALGAQVVHGTNMTFCRMALPLPVGGGAHAGTWYVVLEVDRAGFKRELAKRKRAVESGRMAAVELERLKSHGARYGVTVSSWSNVRMSARLTQTSFEPGATLSVGVVLTEFGQPVEGRARVEADVVRPDAVASTLHLAEQEPGVFAAVIPTGPEGVYRARVRAGGRTLGGSPFTREQLLSAAVVLGGDRLPPPSPEGGESLACLLRCLAREPGGRRWLDEHGIDVERLRECLERCREPTDPAVLDRLG